MLSLRESDDRCWGELPVASGKIPASEKEILLAEQLKSWPIQRRN
jgi:hypothetical protein